MCNWKSHIELQSDNNKKNNSKNTQNEDNKQFVLKLNALATSVQISYMAALSIRNFIVGRVDFPF